MQLSFDPSPFLALLAVAIGASAGAIFTILRRSATGAWVNASVGAMGALAGCLLPSMLRVHLSGGLLLVSAIACSVVLLLLLSTWRPFQSSKPLRDDQAAARMTSARAAEPAKFAQKPLDGLPPSSTGGTGDLFLSYASADRDLAKALASVLQHNGWSVWWDRAIPPGKTFDEVIETALGAAKCVVVLGLTLP